LILLTASGGTPNRQIRQFEAGVRRGRVVRLRGTDHVAFVHDESSS
jgi:hypothetical protein